MPVAVRSKIFTNLLKTKFRDPATSLLPTPTSPQSSTGLRQDTWFFLDNSGHQNPS